MKTIWKYELAIDGEEQHVHMPKNAEILTVQMQYGVPCIWVMCDPNASSTKRLIKTYDTGHLIPDANNKYIGTYQLDSGTLVFHVFEELV